MLASEESRPRDGATTSTAVPTGVSELDQITDGGVRPGSVWLIIGPHGSGRSLLGLQIALAGAAVGRRTTFVSLRDDVSLVARRAERRASRHGAQSSMPVVIGQREMPHLSVLLDKAIRGDWTDLMVIDDVDTFDRDDTAHVLVPGSRRGDELSELLRACARTAGCALVLTRPTVFAEDFSGREIPESWQRSVDVVVRIDRPEWTRASMEPDSSGNLRLAILRNRYGPRAALTVGIVRHGLGLSSERQAPGPG